MHTPVVCPTNKPGTQGGRKAFEDCAVSGTNAPSATQHQCDGCVGFKHRLQDRNSFKKRVSCSLVRAHVDAAAGMPKHRFVVGHAIEIKI